MTGVLSLWNAMVEAAAILAIVVIGIGFMTGMIDACRAWVRIGAVVAILALLLILPPILVGLWHSLSFWQQFGATALLLVLGIILRHNSLRGRRKREH
ncbi:MAG: hypothetical protein ACRD3F_02455 [Acidobacteriaceae bacterium]